MSEAQAAAEVFHAVLRLRTALDAAELDSIDLALFAVYVPGAASVQYRLDAIEVLDGIAFNHPELTGDLFTVRAWIIRGLDGTP